jgi:single-strand selective monofunctional uracil DNA glycosylase
MNLVRRPYMPDSLPLQIARTLSEQVNGLRFGDPVAHVYNPLDYAAEAHAAYLSRYCRPQVSTLLLGMNPGPWGMAQTGVPFGEVNLVRDWLGISAVVRKPAAEHPKRPIDGFDCRRSEVSGQRLWGWARDRFGSPEAFFERFFVWNYCPLAFLEDSGRNRTPDKLPLQERAPLFEACDRALKALIDFIGPTHVLGVGKFAEARALQVAGEGISVGTILHPSPASPAANRGWAEQVEKQLTALDIPLP